MSPLPDERDLPPGRHVQLRDRLLADIAGHTNAGHSPTVLRSHWRVPAVAAAAATGLLAAAVTVGTVRPDDRSSMGGGQTAPTTTSASMGMPTVAGIPPAEADQIVQGCGASFGVPGYGPSRTIGPTENPDAGRNLAVYNLVDDEAGRLALLYGDGVVLLCEIGGGTMPYNPSGGGVAPRVLDGAFDVDHEGAAAGGDVGAPKSGEWGQPGMHAAAGRVGPEVARVTLAADGRTVEANVRNGTFIGRLVYPATWTVPEQFARLEVHAFDAAGRELPATGATRAWP